jgi:hypothetical protein
MTTMAVYEILFVPQSLRYIGSTIDLKRRWRRHRNDLARGVHHSQYLQNLWNKYGQSAFVFKVLEEVQDPTTLLDAEARWIDQLGAVLNTRPPGAFDVQAMLGARRGTEVTQVCPTCHKTFQHAAYRRREFCSPECSRAHTVVQRQTLGRVSRFQGVSLKRESGKWSARLGRQHLGYFDLEEDAAKAYNAAREACGKHYTTRPPGVEPYGPACSVPGCDRTTQVRGLCSRHNRLERLYEPVALECSSGAGTL